MDLVSGDVVRLTLAPEFAAIGELRASRSSRGLFAARNSAKYLALWGGARTRRMSRGMSKLTGGPPDFPRLHAARSAQSRSTTDSGSVTRNVTPCSRAGLPLGDCAALRGFRRTNHGLLLHQLSGELHRAWRDVPGEPRRRPHFLRQRIRVLWSRTHDPRPGNAAALRRRA